mmetsp:Transcript_21259/g.63703  ORF Transcript_21259/g.63703 Transcript_21259/m.63703 type:complete len:283 (+) Transcript_21259:1016-1864(+)
MMMMMPLRRRHVRRGRLCACAVTTAAAAAHVKRIRVVSVVADQQLVARARECDVRGVDACKAHSACTREVCRRERKQRRGARRGRRAAARERRRMQRQHAPVVHVRMRGATARDRQQVWACGADVQRLELNRAVSAAAAAPADREQHVWRGVGVLASRRQPRIKLAHRAVLRRRPEVVRVGRFRFDVLDAVGVAKEDLRAPLTRVDAAAHAGAAAARLPARRVRLVEHVQLHRVVHGARRDAGVACARKKLHPEDVGAVVCVDHKRRTFVLRHAPNEDLSIV